MNKIILSGRLTADPEIKDTETTKVTRYSLAVQRDFKNKDGQYDTDFFRCQTFGKSAEFARTYLKKGVKIIVEGRVQLGHYTNQNGQTVYTTDVIVNNHEFCESKGVTAPVAQPATNAQDTSFLDVSGAIMEEDGLPF